MAEFVPPQFQNPDILSSYIRGQQSGTQTAMAPLQMQGAQQDLQMGGLKMDQLQLAMQQQKMYQQIASGLVSPNGGQQTQTGQTPGGPSGGIQNGPQGSVTSQEPNSYNGSVGGLNPNTVQALALLRGDDPLKTAEGVQNYQQQQKKLQMAGPMSLAETVANSPQADVIIKNNPDLQQRWIQTAPKLGLDPFTDLTPDNARKVAAFGYNNMAAQAGMSPKDFGFTGMIKPGEAAYQNGRIVAGSPDAMTPYQQQELSLRKQEAGLANQRFQFDQNQSKVPNGYEVNPDNPQSIRPIAGGPHDPNAVSAGMDSRSSVMFQRVANAGNSAAESIKNIGELPATTSTGWFGTAQKGTSLLGWVMGVLTQKMNGQDIQDYQTMLAGVSRNLATLETAGLAPGGSLTHSMDALTIGQGDTNMTKLRKMAEMRQIVDTNLTPQLANPRIPPPQKELIQGIVDKVNEAVPFTHHDITQFEQSTNPKATIMDFAKSSGVQAVANKNAGHPADIQDLISKYAK